MGTNEWMNESSDWTTEARTRVPWLVLSSLLAATCVADGPTALTIDQNQAPEINSMEGTCTIPTARTTTIPAGGTFDVALDRSYPYFMYPLIVNRLLPIAHENENEPNRIDVTAVHVKIEAPPGITVPWSDACPAEFDYAPAALVLMPGAESATIVQALRPCHADLFRNLFKAPSVLSSSFSEHVRFRVILQAKGRHGSTRILSAPFEYPVRVCYGCLQTGFPGNFSSFDFPSVPACSQVPEHSLFGNPCNPAQDLGPVLCCSNDPEGLDLTCPAPSVKRTP